MLPCCPVCILVYHVSAVSSPILRPRLWIPRTWQMPVSKTRKVYFSQNAPPKSIHDSMTLQINVHRWLNPRKQPVERNCHEMFWARLTTFHQSWHGDGIVFPILGPLQHRQPHTKARMSSTQKQPIPASFYMTPVHPMSSDLPRHKSCCWPSSLTAFTSSPANLCGVTTNHGYSRLNDYKGPQYIYIYMNGCS